MLKHASRSRHIDPDRPPAAAGGLRSQVPDLVHGPRELLDCRQLLGLGLGLGLGLTLTLPKPPAPRRYPRHPLTRGCPPETARRTWSGTYSGGLPTCDDAR